MTGFDSKRQMAQDKVAQPAQEPGRPWVGLTDKDLKPLSDKWRIVYGGWVEDFAKEIEAALRSKNNGSR